MQGEEQVRDLLNEQHVAAVRVSLTKGAEKHEAKKEVHRLQSLLQFLAPSISSFRPAYRVGEEKVLAAFRRNQKRLGLAS